MPPLKIERFWPKDVKDIAKRISGALEKKDFSLAKELIEDLLDILQDQKRDGKSRVTVCFIIDQLKYVDPLIDQMIEALMTTLNDENDSHVREFAVWALGQLVEESKSIELIKKTMPIFVEFCNDASEHVKSFAVDIKQRLDTFLSEQEFLDAQIKEKMTHFNELINERISDMDERAKEISKEALALDYKNAFYKREEMEKKIRKFKDENASSEDEILALRDQFSDGIPAFKGEARSLINTWREIRGEKEALIRRVHCILRIQGKIYRIITHITQKNNGKIDINELKEETQYSDQEIIEILKKLVNEDIIPNFMLEEVIDDSSRINHGRLSAISDSDAGGKDKNGISDDLVSKESDLSAKKKK